MPDVATSFADLLSAVLDDRQKFSKFLLLLAAVGVLVFGLVWGILGILPRGTKEVKFGSGSILFSQPTEDGKEYLVVISPQGWQETGIDVDEGDKLRFEAGGKVQIDLAGLNEVLKTRIGVDTAKREEHKAEIEKGSAAPEDYYTPDNRKDFRPRWGWTDPGGISVDDMNAAIKKGPASRKRWDRAICPAKGYGALLGAIREPKVQPSPKDAFFIGSGSNGALKAPKSGKLYFAVNDVTNDDKDFPDMFFIDNIGYFYAKVIVEKSSVLSLFRAPREDTCRREAEPALGSK